MKKDFDSSILSRTFNSSIHYDATPEGEKFITFFEGGDLEKEVFLGGTCNGSSWRETFIKFMDTNRIACFNPVVEDWNDDARLAEEEAKLRCGIQLYVITPKMTGTYAIAEAVKSAMINPKGTYFVVLHKDGNHNFDDNQLKSLDAVCDMIEDFGAYSIILHTVNDLDNVAKTIMDSKRGYADTLLIHMQSHPLKYAGILGIQVYDLISLAKSIIQFFNDKFGSAENAKTIRILNKALEAQEERTKDRKARNVEGRDKK